MDLNEDNTDSKSESATLQNRNGDESVMILEEPETSIITIEDSISEPLDITGDLLATEGDEYQAESNAAEVTLTCEYQVIDEFGTFGSQSSSNLEEHEVNGNSEVSMKFKMKFDLLIIHLVYRTKLQSFWRQLYPIWMLHQFHNKNQKAPQDCSSTLNFTIVERILLFKKSSSAL